MMKDTFEITVPVLNEERELEKGILTLSDFLNKNFPSRIQWSIVIADNGSTDGTQEISEKMIKEYSWLKYIRIEKKGVGLALQTSWSQSNAFIVGYLDLDLATDLKHLQEAFCAISEKDYDIVYGTRLHKNSKLAGRSLKREIASRVFNLIVRRYLKIRFSDGMCGFKFLKRSILDELINGGAVSYGWFFSTELLTVSEWKGLKIFELPIHWKDSSESNVKIIPLALQYLKAMKVLKKRKPAYCK